jgi:hypothetical protein
MQPKPTIDEKTGEAFFNVFQTAKVLGLPQKTVWRWANKGTTSFGFDLAVKQVPVIHHRPYGKTKARTFRDTRPLIPANRVFELQAIFREAAVTTVGELSSAAVRDAVRTVVNRHHSLLTLH